MTHETTPRVITPEIKNLCNEIVPNGKIIEVPVMWDSPAPQNQCFHNVNHVVDKIGGKCVTGWAIWQWANILIEAEAHAIWQSPDDTLIDITPHNLQEQTILFLPDKSVRYYGKQIPSKRKALTNSKLVKEFIHIREEIEKISIKSNETYTFIPAEFDRRLNELRVIFNTPVTRNEKCPCGSGLKYKKCCGQYD